MQMYITVLKMNIVPLHSHLLAKYYKVKASPGLENVKSIHKHNLSPC